MKRYFQMDTEITYLEILVIVAILAVVLNVFVPGVLSVVENNRMSTYKKDLQIIKKHVIDYVEEEGDNLSWSKSKNQNEQTKISIKKLVDKGYIEKNKAKQIHCTEVYIIKDKQEHIDVNMDMNVCNGTPGSYLSF